MTGKIEDGGDAFPVSTSYRGMSLRDYFAGQALLRMPLIATGSQITKNGALEIASMARTSYAIADAMIAARKDRP